jgi:U6 snRNA-associated Sm-like protein LSm8
MASYVESLIDELVQVITTDGKVFQGNLKSFDQSMNIILTNCFEKQYSLDQGIVFINMGLYMLRGDSVAIVSEIDDILDKQVNSKDIKGEPLKEIKMHN